MSRTGPLNLAIITDRDRVWAMTAWERTIPALQSRGWTMCGLWTTP